MGRCLIAIVIAGLPVAPPTVAAAKPRRTVAQETSRSTWRLRRYPVYPREIRLCSS
jgi:hypothetical protein